MARLFVALFVEFVLDSPIIDPHVLGGATVWAGSVEDGEIHFDSARELIEYKDPAEWSCIRAGSIGLPEVRPVIEMSINARLESLWLTLCGLRDLVVETFDRVLALGFLEDAGSNIRRRFGETEAIANRRRRGIAFQELVEDIQRYHRWQVKNVNRIGRRTRVSVEEPDTTAITPNNHYVITEVKWEAEKFDGDNTDSFRGKLSRRPAVVHCLVISMAGYTSSAQVRRSESLSAWVIVFFDRTDIEAVVSGERDFNQLFEERRRDLLDRLSDALD